VEAREKQPRRLYTLQQPSDNLAETFNHHICSLLSHFCFEGKDTKDREKKLSSLLSLDRFEQQKAALEREIGQLKALYYLLIASVRKNGPQKSCLYRLSIIS